VSGRTAQQEAFDRYVLPELDVLLRVARSLTATAPDAEDLVQDTLIRAYNAVERFDGRHPRAWLLTILRNTNINRHRRRRPELLDDPDAAYERLAGDGHDEIDAVVDATFDAALTDALDSLTPPFRQVVDLVDIGGASYAEAAASLGVPVGTVMSRLHRARRRLREHLDRAGAGRAR